jgi:hypothetical protein
MKRLLSVVAILLLAASLVPTKSHALLRGAFDFITGTGADPFVRGKFAPALRGGITTGTGTAASPRRERWVTFVTLSSVVGSESTGEIYQVRNQDQSYARGNPVEPLKVDLTGAVSYIDPAWSKDGKWLAYVQTDNSVSSASIYIQEFNTGTGNGFVPAGSPVLVADGTGGIHNRHPAFNDAQNQIAYDSDAAGPSIDLYTVSVALDGVLHTATVGTPVRHELGLDIGTLNGKAEFKPDFSPDGTKIAFVSNRFGAFQIYIVTLTADGLNETTVGAEVNPALVTHDNPSWSSDGGSIYYDAPSAEDPANPQDIWKLDLATGQKCNIFIDLAGDVDPDVSQYTNPTRDGVLYNYFTFISQAGGFGVQVWLAEFVQNCVPALPVQTVVTPNLVDVNAELPDDARYSINLTLPQATRDLGYRARAANVRGEGFRMRRSIISSPTVMGLNGIATPDTGDCTLKDVAAQLGAPGDTSIHMSCDEFVHAVFGDQGWWEMFEDTTTVGGVFNDNHQLRLYHRQRTINERIVALNLVNKYVPFTVRAYTNVTGRQFLGFGYVRLVKSNLQAGSIVMRQNFPNPFNPVTKINFAVDKPGKVDVRVFNVRGELVKTISDTWYPQGEHTVAWDGKTVNGGRAPSGVYYVRARSNGGTDVIKAVLAK